VTDATDVALLAGELCLEFTNTIEGRDGAQPHEFLVSYAHLASWSAHVGILDAEQARALIRAGTDRPDEAEAVLRRALALRELLYRIFHSVLHERPVGGDELAELNAALTETLSRQRIEPRDGGYGWAWPDDGALDGMLWPVVRSAGELLTSERVERLIQCPGCGWLLLDNSRNRSRRWCDMRICGNRAKARRHYERQRDAGAAGPTT
jgi:predicted RNA-binding Zn ribbon-like protein